MTNQLLQIEIRSRDFGLTDAIRSHVTRRMRFALDRFVGRIRHAQVYVGDLNGPKGGPDKYCRIVVDLSSETAVVEETHCDLYRAITRAAHRAAARIGRAVGRANRPAPPRSLLSGGVA